MPVCIQYKTKSIEKQKYTNTRKQGARGDDNIEISIKEQLGIKISSKYLNLTYF